MLQTLASIHYTLTFAPEKNKVSGILTFIQVQSHNNYTRAVGGESGDEARSEVETACQLKYTDIPMKLVDALQMFGVTEIPNVFSLLKLALTLPIAT